MANLKITELPALTVVLGEDLLAIVDDPTGTASTKKIRIDDFQSTWHVGAKVFNSANISIADDTAVALTYDSEEYDTDGIHSTGTNTGRLTCVTAGYYIVIAIVRFETNTTGYRRLYIVNSATGAISTTTQGETSADIQCDLFCAATVYLNVGDYLTASVKHKATVALNVLNYSNASPYFMMHRIG